MSYRYLTNLADVCRSAGLKVVEVDGWKTRGRPPSTGGFNPVGVLCHHTATRASSSDASVLNLLKYGRSDLPGPLCQLGLGRDGTVYVVAAGRANHAGTARQSGTVAGGDGNSLYIGIEAFNDGVGEPWPAAQYEAYVKLCAVLCVKVTGNSAQTVRGHKETSVTGKIDPTFDMGAFRERVADAMPDLRPEPPKPPKPPRPAPVVKVTGIDTLPLGSDHRAVIYRLTLDGKPWMVGTYNLGGKAEGVDVQHLIARLDALNPGRWTLALQETGDQAKTLRHVVATTPGVELVQGPEGLGRAKLATIVPAGTLERQGLVKLTDRTFVGPKGAGGLHTDHKYLLRTRQEVDGTVVRVGNVHLMSSVQGPPTPWRAVRRRLHAKQLARVIEWVGEPTVPTVVVGDFNVDKDGALLDPLRKAGFKIHGRGSFGGPRKNKRAIDLLATTSA